MLQAIKRGAAAAVLSLVTFAAAHDIAAAQGAPPAPGADKTTQGAPTQAEASLAPGPGMSPLEPYLVTWLLPVGGLISVLIAGAVDKQAQASRSGAVRRPAAR